MAAPPASSVQFAALSGRGRRSTMERGLVSVDSFKSPSSITWQKMLMFECRLFLPNVSRAFRAVENSLLSRWRNWEMNEMRKVECRVD
jgi:hypothetical protein